MHPDSTHPPSDNPTWCIEAPLFQSVDLFTAELDPAWYLSNSCKKVIFCTFSMSILGFLESCSTCLIHIASISTHCQNRCRSY